MAVFPENMDKLNPQDTAGSFQKIQDYIRYMGERIEFSIRNVTKTVTAAGVSSAELYVMWSAQRQTLAALQSTVNTMIGNITTLQQEIAGVPEAIADISRRLDDLERRIEALEPTPDPPGGGAPETE